MKDGQEKFENITHPDDNYDHFFADLKKQHTKTQWDCNKTGWTLWEKNVVYVFCCKFSSFLSFEHEEKHHCVFLGYKK